MNTELALFPSSFGRSWAGGNQELCVSLFKTKRAICGHPLQYEQTLPFGTTDDVVSEVRHRISSCGKNGGLILAPSNTVQPDVSVENILALYETAKDLSLG